MDATYKVAIPSNPDEDLFLSLPDSPILQPRREGGEPVYTLPEYQPLGYSYQQLPKDQKPSSVGLQSFLLFLRHTLSHKCLACTSVLTITLSVTILTLLSTLISSLPLINYSFLLNNRPDADIWMLSDYNAGVKRYINRTRVNELLNDMLEYPPVFRYWFRTLPGLEYISVANNKNDTFTAKALPVLNCMFYNNDWESRNPTYAKLNPPALKQNEFYMSKGQMLQKGFSHNQLVYVGYKIASISSLVIRRYMVERSDKYNQTLSDGGFATINKTPVVTFRIKQLPKEYETPSTYQEAFNNQPHLTLFESSHFFRSFNAENTVFRSKEFGEYFNNFDFNELSNYMLLQVNNRYDYFKYADVTKMRNAFVKEISNILHRLGASTQIRTFLPLSSLFNPSSQPSSLVFTMVYLVISGIVAITAFVQMNVFEAIHTKSVYLWSVQLTLGQSSLFGKPGTFFY